MSLNSFFKTKSKTFANTSFSNVRTCGFSLFNVTVNLFGFGIVVQKDHLGLWLNSDGHFYHFLTLYRQTFNQLIEKKC